MYAPEKINQGSPSFSLNQGKYYYGPVVGDKPNNVFVYDRQVLPPQQPYPLYPDLNGASYVPFSSQDIPQKPMLPQSIHGQTTDLLYKAMHLAESILGRLNSSPPPFNPELDEAQATSQSRFFPLYLDVSNRSVNMFNNQTHVHQHRHGERRQDRSGDDQASRFMIGLIGFVVAAVTSFFIGKAMAEGEALQDEALSFKQLKGHWNNQKSFYNEDYQQLVDEITNRADAILQRKEANRTHRVALLIFGLIAGGTAFGGALVGSGAFMTAGIVVGAGVSIAALFKLGYNCFSNRDQKDAEAIDQAYSKLQQTEQPVVIYY